MTETERDSPERDAEDCDAAIRRGLPPCSAPLPIDRAEFPDVDRDTLVRLAGRFCRNRGDAEDAVQDALLTAARRGWQLRRPERRLSWLKTIVVRRALDLSDACLRRRAAERETTARNESRTTDALDALADALRGLIDRLPERQRIAIVLRHLEGCEYPDIAEMMGICESTARVLVRQGRESLRAAVAPG